jgi:hypothetical protein
MFFCEHAGVHGISPSASRCDDDETLKDFAQGSRNDSRRGANFPMLFCGFLSVNNFLRIGTAFRGKKADWADLR